MRPVKMESELKRGRYDAESTAAAKSTDLFYNRCTKFSRNMCNNSLSVVELEQNACRGSAPQEYRILPESGTIDGNIETESYFNHHLTGRIRDDNMWKENRLPTENNHNIQFQNITANYKVQPRELQEARDEKEFAQQFNSSTKELNKVNELKAKCLQLETSQKEAIHAKKLGEEKLNQYKKELDETKTSKDKLREKCIQLENSLAEINQKYRSDMKQLSTPIGQGNNQKAEDKLKIDYENQIAETKQDLQACEKELAESRRQILEYEQKCLDYKRNIEKQSKEIGSNLQQVTKYKEQCQLLSHEVGKKQALLSQNQQFVDQQKSQHLDEVKKLQNDLKKAENSFSNLSKENNLQKKQISEHLDEVQKLQNNLKEARNSLSNLSNEMTSLKKQNASLTNRLATEMSTKISGDERSLENVSVKNRPMNIASEYEMICSNEWHDAKGAVDEKCDGISEDDKIKFLRSIFELSENEVTGQLEKIIVKYQNLINQPFEDSSSASTTMAKSIPDATKVIISDDLRNNADSVNVAAIVQEVKNKTAVDYQHLPSAILTESNVVKFMEASVQLAWKMVLQRPPMHFTQDGLGESWQGETKQEPFWSSSNPSDPQSKVKYYVHPALYHGESMMVKGRVYLSKT